MRLTSYSVVPSRTIFSLKDAWSSSRSRPLAVGHFSSETSTTSSFGRRSASLPAPILKFCRSNAPLSFIEVGASKGSTGLGVAAAFEDGFLLAFSSNFLARSRWSSRGFSGSGFGADLCGSQPERRASRRRVDGAQVMIRHAGADFRDPRMLSAKLGPSGFFFFFFLFFFLFVGGGLPLKSLDTCGDIDQ